MKKLVLIILTVLYVSTAWAQADGSAYSIKNLHSQIQSRDSVLQKIKKSRSRVLIDSLRSQITDYDSLTKSMEVRYESLVKVVNAYKLLTSLDTLVFYSTFNHFDVPQSLKKHIYLIEKIASVRTSIERIERKIDNLKSRLNGLNVNSKQVIQKEIEKDVTKLDAIISEIEKMDLFTLSHEQQVYFKPGLTERYNKFLIYFE